MSRAHVYVVLAVFVTSVTLSVANVWYTNHVQREAERRNEIRIRQICGLMVVLDDAYQQTPPTSVVGRNVADQIHRYRVAIGC